MDKSLNDSQRSSVEFLNKTDLLLLYEVEYTIEYVSAKKQVGTGQQVFGPFLPTDKKTWVEEMTSIQKTFAQRNATIGIYDVHEAVARVMFLIIKGHKLVDGNKRSSIICMIGLYALNNYEVVVDKDDIYNKVKEIATLDSQHCNDEKEIMKLKEFLQQGTQQHKEKVNFIEELIKTLRDKIKR